MKHLLFISILFLSLKVQAQIPLSSIHDLDSLLNNSEKYTAVLISAPWCKYCSMMKESFKVNTEMTDAINASYNFIDLDSEMKESVMVGGRTYFYRSNGSNGKNEIAIELGEIDGKFSLPTLTILNSNNEIIFQHAGYLPLNDLQKLLISVN